MTGDCFETFPFLLWDSSVEQEQRRGFVSELFPGEQRHGAVGRRPCGFLLSDVVALAGESYALFCFTR